jgi:hypothetical protein
MEETETLVNAVINEINTVNNVCTLCSLIMEDNQPRTELMCHHTFHTACFLTEIYLHRIYCSSCNQDIYTGQIIEEATENHQHHRQVKLNERLKKFQENHEAVEDLKLLKKQITKTKKAYGLLSKYMRTQRTEHKEEAGQLSKLLKDMIMKRKNNVITSEQHAKWKTEKIRLQRYMNVFNRKYHQLPYRELQEIPQLKLPVRWSLRQFTQLYSRRFYRYFQ